MVIVRDHRTVQDMAMNKIITTTGPLRDFNPEVLMLSMTIIRDLKVTIHNGHTIIIRNTVEEDNILKLNTIKIGIPTIVILHIVTTTVPKVDLIADTFEVATANIMVGQCPMLLPLLQKEGIPITIENTGGTMVAEPAIVGNKEAGGMDLRRRDLLL